MKSWWFDYFSKGNLNWEKRLWKTRNWEIHEKLMMWLLFKRKFKLGKTSVENQELRNPWKVGDFTTFRKEIYAGKNICGKPGIEKSMKSWWFDYFSKGNLNWEKHPWKIRNWEFHEKLMIWLCLHFSKANLNWENHLWKTRNWEIHEHTSIHASMHAWMHTNKHTYIRTYVHTYIHTHIHTHIHTYVYIFMQTYIDTFVCMVDCAYILEFLPSGLRNWKRREDTHLLGGSLKRSKRRDTQDKRRKEESWKSKS